MPIRGPRYTGKKKSPQPPQVPDTSGLGFHPGPSINLRKPTATPTWSPPRMEMNPNRGMPMPTPMPEPGMMESMRSFLDRFDTLMKAFKGGK